MKGPAHTIDSIEKAIEDLLIRGYDGGFLIIDVSGTDYFIQLRKYILASGNYGIELSFPKAKWSEFFFTALVAYCDKAQINYTISKGDASKEELDFLDIDFGKETHEAHNFIKNIITEIFGLKRDVKLFVRLENAALA
ncbi:hypothetical protein VU01_10971 [Candidatus Electrothrix marina]|uniref:Uncharacterized protein n=1 Tax=Candidatus Electrothrix marina TaxID=1859130 RepID=A0A444JF36_9BACT|nr:hypothetical protein VU01_10971 [Candidatus Electrothrix marina]